MRKRSGPLEESSSPSGKAAASITEATRFSAFEHVNVLAKCSDYLAVLIQDRRVAKYGNLAVRKQVEKLRKYGRNGKDS